MLLQQKSDRAQRLSRGCIWKRGAQHVLAQQNILVWRPIMIVVMGALAGGVIFALYLPIFSLGQAIKGSVR